MFGDCHQSSHRLLVAGDKPAGRKQNGNRIRSVPALALLLVMPFFAPEAAEIYKWVDEHGRVQYGDQPPSTDVPAMQIDTVPRSDADAAEKQERQQRLLEVFTEERENKAQDTEQARNDEKQRRENCERAQQNLQRVREAGFIYESTSDPYNPRILTESERGEVMLSAESNVKKWCG